MRSRGTTRWAPRLGSKRIDGLANGWPGSAAYTPVASTTTRARISGAPPPLVSVAETVRSAPAPGSGFKPVARNRVTATGADGWASAVRSTPGEARVVLDAVVIEEPTAQAGASERGPDGQRALDVETLVPAAVVSSAEDVVQRQAGVIERLVEDRQPVDREELRLEADEMRRIRQAPSLGQRLADQRQVHLLEIAQPAVDQP